MPSKDEDVIESAIKQLDNLKNRTLNVLDISKPIDAEYAKNIILILSKISPLVGNMIEFTALEQLSGLKWHGDGKWVRQDPGFPDLLFKGDIKPSPGIEIKTWFPLATEITARFRESINSLNKNTRLVLMAWLPEHIIYGKPKIIDLWVGNALDLALTRDKHYHNPPDYIVFEPEDTSSRTGNLQQTNTNGFKFQGTKEQFIKAEKEVSKWSVNPKTYSALLSYQTQLKSLLKTYPYRGDTNFSKIDRINHTGLEEFKKKILNTTLNGHKILEWSELSEVDSHKATALLNELV